MFSISRWLEFVVLFTTVSSKLFVIKLKVPEEITGTGGNKLHQAIMYLETLGLQ